MFTTTKKTLTIVIKGNKNSSCTDTYLPSLKPSKLDEPDMQDTAREIRTYLSATFSFGPLHTEEKVLDDQLEIIYKSSLRIQYIV